ncbi:FmdB family zinc ribbon protein [Hydrogenophaga sp.]|uniref:FmdB family zinc ribbon protein n=1 Tax=Hydrogenophaga sp. TaxID=1904254 RepID=UPI00271EC89F|nr:FmdB family zinc ribbon protein [Hydrogenophaga sp.]MDO9434759.1 zinc ribbon domain-containing protein [Hydrogenophaga sp.]
MPIYAYKCESCGHAKDVLQKMSDTPLSVCPSCGQASFKKQLTSAGFQLKGSGWYVTDFREGNKPAAGAAAPASGATDASDSKPAGDAATPASAPAAAPAPASAPAPAATAPTKVTPSSSGS